ncbi:hypothetical protein TBLA_0A10480 [Henningerozyma blattae CBS 6284]|uniref:Uncharacterized protein n=1 Tax=Henningerozyma blattae (strain ATCC 34711 / CBS 6284 / DSM 70876 / NBRC 10599 / NRRL Y-10934 / UCD 77-7) TaxID=1071380 RepID=I2GXH4_HENB6|nr:hypothetical protein TBLA_0A10480 [Tetrapisispora blattae CBS 6284]CCH58826.1 hypothetical protein TBLA_0A10480 [Tetrapisispora blattae CBS 6284]
MTTLLYDSINYSNSLPRFYDMSSYRITVMGSHSSGKTSLIHNWLNDQFNSKVLSNVSNDDIYYKSIHLNSTSNINCKYVKKLNSIMHLNKLNKKLNKATLQLQFLDSIPIDIEDYSDIRSEQLLQSDSFVLCFDPTSVESFNELRYYFITIDRVFNSSNSQLALPPIFIVNTKSDLNYKRTVSIQEVNLLMYKLNLSINKYYFEITSKLNLNTQNLLFTILIEIEKNKLKNKLIFENLSNNNSNTNKTLSKDDSNSCSVTGSASASPINNIPSDDATITSTSSNSTITSFVSSTQDPNNLITKSTPPTPTTTATTTTATTTTTTPSSTSNHSRTRSTSELPPLYTRHHTNPLSTNSATSPIHCNKKKLFRFNTTTNLLETTNSTSLLPHTSRLDNGSTSPSKDNNNVCILC